MRAIQQHDADATSTETRAVSEAPSPWLALRVVLTVAAAVLLLVGSFLEWANGIDGSELAVQSFWSTDAGTAGFFSSAGLVTAICGAVIILGLAFRGGWLTRFAGAVALVAFTLVVIQTGPRGVAGLPPGCRYRALVRARGWCPRVDRRVLPVHANGRRVHRIHGHGLRHG